MKEQNLMYTTLIIAVIALIVSVTAYYRATQNPYYGLEDQVAEELAQMQLETQIAFTRADSRAELFALRTEMATEEFVDDAEERVVALRARLARVYEQASTDAQQEAKQVDDALQNLEVAIRTQSADVADKLEDAIDALEQDVRGSIIEQCIESGGTWTQFNDACADRCDYIRGTSPVCSQAIMTSCDCGPNECWDGTTCTTN